MKTRKGGSIIAIALAALGTLVLTCCRPAAVEAAYPIENASRTFVDKVWSRVVGAFRGGAANAENVELRREIAALRLLRMDVERLANENARLRRALDYAERQPETWVAAAVLSADGGAAGVRRSLRVNRGSLAGVKEGAVVVAPDGIVGRVTAVSPHTSEVTLVTDSSVKVACEVEAASPEKIRGVLVGGEDDMLRLKLLRNVGSLPPRSRVLTSGLGGVFPRGIEVGTLLVVTNRIRSVEGEVLPSVDYSTLEDVFICRGK